MNTTGIDLQSRNSHRKYPFVDYADMRYEHITDAENAGDFPTDVLVNAQFTCPEISFVAVHLRLITVAVEGANKTVSFSFILRPVEHTSLSPVYRRDGMIIPVTVTITPGQTIPPDWVTQVVYHDIPYAGLPPPAGTSIKLLFGTGILDVAQWDVGTYDLLGDPRILPSLAIHYDPGLQYISVLGRAYSGDVRFAAGANAEAGVDPIGGSVTINAGPEYGTPPDCTGRRECTAADLLSINGVYADQDTGDLVIAGVGGATVEADYDAMELVVRFPPPANCRGTVGA